MAEFVVVAVGVFFLFVFDAYFLLKTKQKQKPSLMKPVLVRLFS